MKTFLSIVMLGAMTSLMLGCRGTDKSAATKPKLYNLEGFVEQRNAQIATMLTKRVASAKKQIAEIEEQISSEEKPAIKVRLERKLVAAKRELEKLDYRVSRGDYIQIKEAKDLPEGLVWEDGLDEPEVGDPKAQKGGVFNTFIADFPATLRPFGPKANHSFRGKLYDEIDMSLVHYHPMTQKAMPAVAHKWSISKDRRTVFFEIDPKATYSDGKPIKALDIITTVYVQTSQNVFNAFGKKRYNDSFANFTVYGDKHISISIPEVVPRIFNNCNAVPSPPHFYSEYGPDYKTRYQWRVPPTTGAYEVKKKDIVKGRSITLSRVKDWWAKDSKFYKNLYNPDKIRYTVIRDRSKQFELFKTGQIDAFWVSQPEYWYDKTEMEPVFNGYIHKTRFYNLYPRIPWGIYLNVDEGILKNKDLRLGVHHAMNFQKVNDQVFRGDYVRLNQFSDGYGSFTNPDVKARRYNVAKARELFAKAGFINEIDGILHNAEGKKLSFSCTINMASSTRKAILDTLRSEAKHCGLDLRIDALDANISFSKTSDKKHESTYSGWGVQPPYPKFRQFFHSENAFDENGNRKTNTNNQNVFANDRVDVLSDIVRYARTEDELRKAAYEAQQIIHDEAIFVPGLDKNYTSLAYWRWVKWPDTADTKFCLPRVYEPLESYCFWIDQDAKEETTKARKRKEAFPEVEQMVDFYIRNPKEKK